MARVVAEVVEMKAENPFSEHCEYEVKCEAFGPEVVRRSYKDFDELYTHLLKQYTYRMVPALPPRQMMQDLLPVERCHALQMWLTVVTMNPVLKRSPMMLIFLRESTPDYQNLLHDEYKKKLEYSGSEFDDNFELSMKDKSRLSELREHLPRILHSLKKLYIILDEQSKPVDQQTHTIDEVDGILRNLEMDDLRGVDICATNISQSNRDKTKVIVEAFVNLFAAYLDLCERAEKEFPEMLAIHMEDLDQDTSSSDIDSVPAEQEANQPAQAESPTGTLNDPKCSFASQCFFQETAVVEGLLELLPEIMLAYADKETHQNLLELIDLDSITDLQLE